MLVRPVLLIIKSEQLLYFAIFYHFITIGKSGKIRLKFLELLSTTLEFSYETKKLENSYKIR